MRHHHERWDGGGLPGPAVRDARSRSSARIIFVADAYDAMTSDRVYRAALADSRWRSRSSAALRGTQFDPEVVAAFAEELGGVLRAVPALADLGQGLTRPGRSRGSPR